MHGRIQLDGRVHRVRPHGANDVLLEDGRVVSQHDVLWLPPIDVGTVFALGLNYADHAAELAFAPPTSPLVFLKSRNSLIGHNGVTPRPADAAFMHYECELAVVIGQTAQYVAVQDASAYIAGYTIANDYAVRDYLENYYRPNLRVKNRDASTPMGPWLVTADELNAQGLDPMVLRLTTRVNGRVTQSGGTRDMVFGVAQLIAYLSGFMTLHAGDVILTGTPEGLVNVVAGDVVETEIEGLGVLRNTLASPR